MGDTLGHPNENTLSLIQQKHMLIRLTHVAALVNT